MAPKISPGGWNAPATIAAIITLGSALSSPAQAHTKPAPSAGVEELCSITFDKDVLRPARVENSAAACLKQAAERLKTNPDKKLVLVGVKDPAKDHEPTGAGSDREEEDASGFDVRLEDLSAYRAVNTKWYLVKYLNADPKRIVPTTDETYFAQTVTFYLVPASADFNHNFLGTTKTNEKPCTITPCYSPDEETLTPQHRPRILTGAVDGSPAEIEAEKKELAALQHHHKSIDMEGSAGEVALTPLPEPPTPEHPATVSIVPR
ncbi:OmpA family protein [Granulicella aggregans]|jgi:hypothetical protein|uniref:hypothetical protein n=1 Tax=Granulicella aggregans TaxID=474949 RepID=UPI0021DFAF4B|nr:hypothetical protein [Granulicella aggregans]